MKKVVVGILAIVGLLSILAVMALAAISMISMFAKPGVPSNTILEIDFENPDDRGHAG